MNALFIHDDAAADLEALWQREPYAAGQIVALLEELEGNHDLLDRLTQHKFGASHTSEFHVSKWQEQWRKGRDLWRLKLWDLEDKGLRYRIIYAFMPKRQHYHVLAIAPREFNYDSQHPLTQRILRAYKELGGNC
ncbi:MAG: hypothetical protein ACYDHY_13065 [Acidiferrobacterales bacterium]